MRRRSTICSLLLALNLIRASGLASDETPGRPVAGLSDSLTYAPALKHFQAEEYSKALELLTPLRRERDAIALCWVAAMHELGLGIDIDNAKALKYFHRAADKGSLAAARLLAWKFANGIGVDVDSEAAAYYEGLVQGNSSAATLTKIDWLILEGPAFSRNYPKALAWNLRAAKQEDPIALYNLGVIYERGLGAEADPEQALAWITRAAEAGHPTAQWMLGLYIMESEIGPEGAIEWFEQAAEQGNLEAQKTLARFYENGTGVEKDYEQALKWYKRAAIRGDAEAQSKVGMFYDSGLGVEKDVNQSFYWNQIAAQRGDVRAQTLLGKAYISGKGTKRNVKLGKEWLEKAAVSDSPLAQYYLGAIYSGIFSQDDRDDQKAMDLYMKAAEAGVPNAQLVIAQTYASGTVGDVSKPESKVWLKAAAEQNFAPAEYLLAMWHFKGEQMDKDVDAFLYWLDRAALHGHRQARGLMQRINHAGADDVEFVVKRFLTGHVIRGAEKEYIRIMNEELKSMGDSFNRPPRPIEVATPMYPAHLQSRHVTGRVTLLVWVDEQGRVTEAEIETSTHPDFAGPALAAVQRWKFQPAFENGKPTKTKLRLPIRFK